MYWHFLLKILREGMSQCIVASIIELDHQLFNAWMSEIIGMILNIDELVKSLKTKIGIHVFIKTILKEQTVIQ